MFSSRGQSAEAFLDDFWGDLKFVSNSSMAEEDFPQYLDYVIKKYETESGHSPSIARSKLLFAAQDRAKKEYIEASRLDHNFARISRTTGEQ